MFQIFFGPLRTLSIVLCFCIGILSCTHKQDWVGTYSFFEEVPTQSHDEPPLQWMYQFKVQEEGDQLKGCLLINGFETKDSIACRIQLEGSTLQVFGILPQKSTSESLLFELKHDEGKIATDWKVLIPRMGVDKGFKKE